MAAPPSAPTSSKSRGLSLFDRQAQLHAHDTDKTSSNSSKNFFDKPTTPSKSMQLITSAPAIYRSTQYNQYSPLLAHRQSPLSTSEYNSDSTNNNNVQLIGIHPRPESTYIKEWPSPPTLPFKNNEHLQETDFPLVENSSVQDSQTSASNLAPSDSLCCAMIEQAFDYLQTHDDNDDVVYKKPSIEQIDGSDNEENSEGNDSVDTIDLDATTSTNHQTDSGFHTIPFQSNSDKQHNSQEKLTDQQSPMASSSRGTGSEDNDSDFDTQSHEDDLDNEEEPIIVRKAPEELINEQEELKKQLIIRQQKILWDIAQEWLRKEKSYIEQLELLDQQLSHMSLAITVQEMIQQLISHHRNVCKEIEFLYERDHHPSNLIKQLARAIDTLMQTLSIYDDYIKRNLAPIRKALDKRLTTNGMSSEDLLSIPPKQFLQILSQVQDLHKTAQSLESNDRESLTKLYNYALRCKMFGSSQDENINKIILKNEDVATITRGSRDRCRLVLYPDAIVCCVLKTKLLASPKYVLLSFIPMINLHWTVPQTSSDDNTNTGDELKSNLKTSYKELEKAPKSNNVVSSRLSKAIRKQENEYNLAQSKLQLILSNVPSSSVSPSSSRSSVSSVILFSSAYQRQDWIDSIEKTKQELVQRSSDVPKTTNTNHQRLTDSLIQKRLDLIKANVQECNSYDSSSVPKPSKTYSGTLHITIQGIHGSALSNPARQQTTLPLLPTSSENNYQFYVAVEIDSYNTFFPYAQTAKRSMQQQESVEFRGEKCQPHFYYSIRWPKTVSSSLLI
ncbi:hypothetical protein I4U23_026328 [Adineta vaga]|nr:hypothetical protein I4U23_026328 [Adineta vaga]